MRFGQRNKFNARKVTVDGHTFDSQREHRVWCDLRLRERAGEIRDLKRQVKFELIVSGIKIATYRADFAFVEKDTCRVIDVKSEPTAKKRDFVLVRKLMRACHGIHVEVML